MDLENLKTFYTVTQHKSFQKAADILLVTQSGISRRIQSLENELGVPLLQRTPQSVTLTKQGMEFLPYAERIIRIMEESTKVIQNVQKEEEFIIALPSSTYSFLPILIKEFIIKHPAHLMVYSSNSQQVYEMLIDQSVDIGLTTAVFPSPQIMYERIHTERLVCVGSPDFVQKYIIQDMIITQPIPFIFSKLHKFKSQPWDSLYEAILNNSLLKIIVEVNQFQIAKGLAINGTGLVILPISEVKENIDSGELVEVTLPNMNLPNRPAYLATYKKHHKKHLLTEFKKIVKELASSF